MQADWEVEIGGSSPVIDALWPGFIDLRRAPERATELPESSQLPGLARSLVELNADTSLVWTAKCDVWQVAPISAFGEDVECDAPVFDLDELDAPQESKCGLACYIDLLPCKDEQWPTPALAVEWCKEVCSRIGDIQLKSCRVDLIVRSAILPTGHSPDRMNLGITAYLTACGSTGPEAALRLNQALAAFAATIRKHSTVE
jgi:hypothetical protein